MSVPGEKKINRKRLEHLERCRRKEEAKNTKSKLKKLARIVERKKQKQTRDSLIEQLSQFQHTAFTNLIPTAKMHLKCYQSEPDREIDSNVSSSVKFPKKLRCVSGSKLQSLATARKRQQENYYETGSSSDGEDGPSADRNASDFVLLDEFKKEPLDGVDADDTLADAFASARAPTTKTKLMICKNNDIVDEQVKRSCEEQNAMAKMLAKIKGAKVVVPRLDAIEAQRRKLPIHAEEQEIVEAINENEVVVICGETGSGKTTQIPQFLYEAGYTSNGHLIGVTEPRRIAAISMAERVGRELCAPELSAYQIRFEGNRTERTKLLFVTDGVLLRELQTDPMLLRFSVIVIDEAHERSVYSDVLIGLLSRISIARQKSGIPLKLIIMSATLRLSDFFHRRLFPQTEPKVIEVNARQFDVTIHFERCTPRDYLKAAFRKVCKIHRRLPEGGILVFLSGQREVEQLIRRLAARFPKTNTDDQQKADAGEKTKKRKRTKRKTKANNSSCDEDLVVDYEEFGAADADPKSSVDERTLFHDAQSDENDSDDDDDDELMDELASGDKFLPLHCLPLYSLLSSERQRKVFEPVPQGHRLCVVATNVAETSLTIPNIRYVVDSGVEKRRHFDPITGVSRFCVEWISSASADQRSGRAGRVRAGHAYRLYSSAVYQDFARFAPPDILNQPIEQLVLHLKAMNFVKLTNFPFPTPPAADQIKIAEQRLENLGALSRSTEEDYAKITPFGRTLAQIPLAPPFAYLLAYSNHDALLPLAIALVAALSVREPLVAIALLRADSASATQEAMTRMLKQRRAWCKLGEARQLGDLCVLLHLIGVADHEPHVTANFLTDLGLRPKPYFEIRRLRRQLVNVVNESSSIKEKLDPDHKLLPPTQEQMRFIRETIAHSLPEQIAKRVDRSADNSVAPKGAYKCQRLEEFVFIDSTSMLYRDEPDFVLYQEIVQLGHKKCMQNVSVVDEEWIPKGVKKKFDDQ